MGRFYGNFMEIIGLKAPGNYSASFRSNNFRFAYVRDQKTNIVMISGFVDPGQPLFMDLNIPNYFKTYTRNRNIVLKHIIFENLDLGNPEF